MLLMALRSEVLSAYRKIFRVARTWQAQIQGDTQHERKFIKDEARKLFRKNISLTEENEIKDCIKEAETRIELAYHYKIPYPRLVNIPQTVLPPTGHKRLKAQRRMIKYSKPIYMKSLDDEPDKPS